MDVFEAITTRGSHRKYLQTPVPREVITRCVEMAGRAPSPHNDQMWHFTVVTSREAIEQMAHEVDSELDALFVTLDSTDPTAKMVRKFSTFFRHAPAVVAVLMEPYVSVIGKVLPQIGMDHTETNEKRGNPDYQAVGAAIQNFLLAATAQGYATCWLSGPVFARERLEKVLGVTNPWGLVALITIGLPDGEIRQSPRKSVSEIISFVE